MGRIGAIARGVLAGGLQNRAAAQAEAERQRREQLENLQLAARLAEMEGFSFEDDEEEPDAPTGSGEVDPSRTSRQMREGFAGMLGEDEAPMRDPEAPQRRSPQSPAGNTPARPRSAMEIARITIGGRERGVRFDPTQTATARRARRDQLNRAAHAAIAPDEEYDESVDYAKRRQSKAELDATVQAIIDSGIETDPKKARAWAIANPTLERITRANAPKPPVRGTPEYNAAIEAEAAARRRGAPPRPRSPERARGPVRGTPEYLAAVAAEQRQAERIRAEAEAERARNTPMARRKELLDRYNAAKTAIKQRFTGAEQRAKLREAAATYEAEKAKIPLS